MIIMRLNGKDINIEDIITEVDIDANIPKKRNNNLVLRDSQIEILKKTVNILNNFIR